MKTHKMLMIVLCLAGYTNLLKAQTEKTIDAFSKSYEFEAASDYSKAINTMKEVYTESSYEVNLRLGWLHYMAGLFTESSAYYQKAIAVMPYSIEAKLGNTYPQAAVGNWDKVLAEYNNVLTIDPQNSTVNYKAGNIYYGRKDYQRAFKNFEKVVNLYPFGYDALLMFAWTNYQLGKLREAKVLFSKVLMIYPNDKSAKEGLALIK
jgi:tetratricopeptide (TPR) repeat protein